MEKKLREASEELRRIDKATLKTSRVLRTVGTLPSLKFQQNESNIYNCITCHSFKIIKKINEYSN